MSENFMSTASTIANLAIDPMAAKLNTTVAYTDGACKGNPGAGGWGAHLIFSDGSTQDLYGGEADTTNNRMELMGAIQALKHSPNELKLEIWTDSSYVKNGITEWIANWKKRGWKTASKKPVANQDLWQQLDALNSAREVSWHWVKGHAGHVGNEKADELANLGVNSSSEQDTDQQDTNSIAKKKLSIADNSDTVAKELFNNEPQALADEDWLDFDPLGLDALDDEAETEEANDPMDGSFSDDLYLSSSSDVSHDSNYPLNDESSNDLALQIRVAVNSPQPAYDVTIDKAAIDNITINSATTDSANTNNAKTDNAINNAKAKLDAPALSISSPISTLTMITNTMTTDAMVTNVMTTDNLSIDNKDLTEVTKFDGDTSRANPNFRPLLPKPIHRGETNRQLIMDTETTGLDALKGDRIIEVGIVEMIGRKFTGEKLHVYINPQRGMDEVVVRIHGISEAFLTDKPTFDQVAQSLYDFMDGAEIIAHNASFDMSFLTMEFDRVGMTDFAQRVQVTDSLFMAKQQYPGQKNTLDALVRRLDVGKQDRTFHGALLDSEILAEVYLAMTGGQVTLGIEEDSQTEGGHTAHSNFANLAALLVDSAADRTANEAWFANLAEKNPELKTKMTQW
ncbi:DNA polymerase III subunit epsilon [Psychrobacter sp. TAE2020]|uniref:DNA polymerase III subunit epsilon n=1 Tax=Psychrobacter sp. TAE2020 TaxID=2846762 RepID=UPI001E374F80|nr:DNA polymerase III subunit epsilon [Psychrobacter sp. TAE2020]